jgi:SagB-type dehydrogenase family enzyme
VDRREADHEGRGYPDLDSEEGKEKMMVSSDGRMQSLRAFLKDSARKYFDFSTTDQNLGLAPPSIQKPVEKGAMLIDLAVPGKWKEVRGIELQEAMRNRRSHRKFNGSPISLDELSFLLWATQGVRDKPTPTHAFRTVPSAGCRHALETYIAAIRVEGLAVGLYRYLPISHQLVLERSDESISSKLVEGTLHQQFIGQAALVLIWTTIPYRMEWRYGEVAHKVIALDAGHVCQNLYLACEAMGAGACAIAAYDQELMDKLLHIDGGEEFTIYLAPVGRV